MIRNSLTSPEGLHGKIRAALVTDIKVRQSMKIREIGQALIAAGFFTLDEQTKALGVPRSTAWTILQARHKNYGLSEKLIKRMLASQHLPPLVRSKIIEYRERKLPASTVEHSTAKIFRKQVIARMVDRQRVERSHSDGKPAHRSLSRSVASAAAWWNLALSLEELCTSR